MAGETNQNIDDVKGVFALLVLVVYIGASVWIWGFSLSGVMALATFFIALFGGIRPMEGKKGQQKNYGGLDPQGLILFLIWLGLFIAWLFYFKDSDYSGRIMFLMFAAAISTSMELKNIILFLGLSILTSFFFESGVLASIVLIATALFAYACRESTIFGAIMMIPLLMVGWFIGSGWGVAVTQKVDSLSTQISATTGISTEGISSKIAVALNDTWLLLTNPSEWYTKQEAIQTNRDSGATSLALEITKIEPLPKVVNPKDTFDITFELENKGTKSAKNVLIGAKATTLADACGKIGGKFCNLNCITDDMGTIDMTRLAEIKDGCPIDKSINTIAPSEMRFDAFSFRAPECSGTYLVSAMVVYDYTVDATLNMQMISKDYFDELLRNNKMVWVDELSTTSAGPFKLSLRTSRKQPIPDLDAEGNPQKFKIYMGFVNEHLGRAVMNAATIKLPKELELVGWDSSANAFDDSCNLLYGVPDASGKYFSDDLKDKLASGMITYADYITLENKYKQLAIDAEAKTNDGYLTYRVVDYEKRKMNQNDWRYYSCTFQPVKGTKINQIQTWFARANMDYTFEYEKSTSVTVRSLATIPPHCDKKLQPVSAISTVQKVPQLKDAIITELAKEMFNCYNKNDKSLYHTSSDCGKFKIDITGCVDTITPGDIFSKISSGAPYDNMTTSNINVWAITKKYTEADASLKKNTIDILDSSQASTDVFKSTDITQISMQYVSYDYLLPFLLSNPLGVALMVVDPAFLRNSLIINIDTVTPDLLCTTP